MNNPKTFVLSAVQQSNEVHLSWTYEGDFSHFNVYRDGTLIGSTNKTKMFTDVNTDPYEIYDYKVTEVTFSNESHYSTLRFRLV